MMWTKRSKCVLAGLLVGLIGVTGAFGADTPQDLFYQAYYLEQTGGDLEQAIGLYGKVLASPTADSTLRAKAKTRLAACREELASRDFARLMPPKTLVYVELTRPGDQLGTLLKELGLVANGKPTWAEGSRRVAISPILIEEALGLGGAAVAVTGFDPAKQAPTGVLVFNPGSVEVIRGLIETALPSGGTLVEPIQGYTTYDVEGQCLVSSCCMGRVFALAGAVWAALSGRFVT